MYDINDYDFKKDDVIETPLQLAKFIYNKINDLLIRIKI
jgi:hypothetical protein